MSLCACLCARARVRACAWVLACVTGRVAVCMCMRVCSHAYPACNAYAPYCEVLRDPSGSTIFFDVINGTIFAKKLLNIKCVF